MTRLLVPTGLETYPGTRSLSMVCDEPHGDGWSNGHKDGHNLDDSELAELIERWPFLTAEVRREILNLAGL